MPRFCQECEALLVKQITATTFAFLCPECKITYVPTAEDTCIFVEDRRTPASNVVAQAGYDAAAMRVFRDCEKCANKIAIVTRNSSLAITHICTKCGNRTT